MAPLILAVLSYAAAAATEDLNVRAATLDFHLERLRAITVPEDLNSEKEGKVAELVRRLDAGVNSVDEYNEIYRAIDAVRTWLLSHAVDKPALPPGTFEDAGTAWRIITPGLTLELAKENFATVVRTPSQEWQFAPCDDHDVHYAGATFSLRAARQCMAEPFITGYSVGMLITLSDFPEAPGFELRVCANVTGNEVVFELAAREPGAALSLLNWPKPIVSGNTAGDLSVIPLMQGMLLPGDWPQDVHYADLCNSRTLYMPWWGQIHEGRGVQTILETSDDAGAAYDHPLGGPTTIAPRWYPSLGQLRYQRVIRYVFDDNATYVTMAKRYRRYVREHGRFVSLEEKRSRTPALDEVIGKPVVHLGALYHFVEEASLFNKERIEANHALSTFDQLADGLRRLKSAGIDRAYVHLDGWGFYGYDNGHPDVMPVGEEQGGWDGLRRFADTCAALGYLFAVHDQYRDFYFNAVSFDDRLAATRLDGSREQHSTWCGGPQTILSPRFAPEYVRRNHDQFAAHGINVRGAYLDVFSVVPLEESAQPAHPLTRSECAQYRRECFDLLRARGYVVSSEEPSDYLVRSLDLVHHGPYATSPNLGGGGPVGIPIPLFNLVYHDSLLLPWDMGEDGGWGIPTGDAGRLHCLLNAGLPYVGPGASPEQVARVNEAAALAARSGTREMVDHAFLDTSRRKQRTRFSDGAQVTVDFAAKTYTIEYGP